MIAWQFSLSLTRKLMGTLYALMTALSTLIHLFHCKTDLFLFLIKNKISFKVYIKNGDEDYKYSTHFI